MFESLSRSHSHHTLVKQVQDGRQLKSEGEGTGAYSWPQATQKATLCALQRHLWNT